MCSQREFVCLGYADMLLSQCTKLYTFESEIRKFLRKGIVGTQNGQTTTKPAAEEIAEQTPAPSEGLERCIFLDGSFSRENKLQGDFFNWSRPEKF